MRRHALWAAAIVLVLGAGSAEAAKSPSSTRASGPSPFPATGCGQIDQAYYGSQRGMEADLALAADPDDARHLVAAWIQDEGFGIVTATSFDGGRTWKRAVVPNITVCTGGPAQRVLHARLAFGPGGHVWVAGEVLDGYFPDPRSGLNGIAVAGSSDGGRSWSPAARVETLPAMNGLNHIVADPSSPGSVVVSWHTPEPIATSYLSRSDDGGRTWAAAAVPSYALDALPFQRLIIGPDGTYLLATVQATLRTFAASSAALTVRRSTDRGRTWTGPVTLATDVPWQWPSGGVGPDGTAYVQWLADAGNGTRDLYVARSSDWSHPVLVAGGLIGPEPSLAVTPSGALAVAHTAAADGRRVLRLARSSDRGATWTTTVLDGPYDAPAYEGFYNDTAALADGKVAAVYTKAGADTDGPTDVFVAIRR